MPEPVGNSSRFDPSQDWCIAELEEPPVEPAIDTGGQVEEAASAALVLSVGIAGSAESTFASAASPVTAFPGGGAVAFGLYFDVARLEIGSYRRVEVRESAGSFAGAGVEVGVAASRNGFDGESAVAFGEGGSLGRFGYSASNSGVSVGVGLGVGAAAGVSVAETVTEPVVELGRFLESGASPLRRGP